MTTAGTPFCLGVHPAFPDSETGDSRPVDYNSKIKRNSSKETTIFAVAVADETIRSDKIGRAQGWKTQ